MEKEFNRQLDNHLNQWVQNSQSKNWSRTNSKFFTVNDDTTVNVDLNKLSDGYRKKLVVSQPSSYCEAFLGLIEPYLTQFLIQFGIKDYRFTFVFNIAGNMEKNLYVNTLGRN